MPKTKSRYEAGTALPIEPPRLVPSADPRDHAVVRKDLKELLREAEGQGWRIEYGGKHIKAFAPDGKTIVTLPSTPGGSLAPYVVRMRRAGLRRKGR